MAESKQISGSFRIKAKKKGKSKKKFGPKVSRPKAYRGQGRNP